MGIPEVIRSLLIKAKLWFSFRRMHFTMHFCLVPQFLQLIPFPNCHHLMPAIYNLIKPTINIFSRIAIKSKIQNLISYSVIPYFQGHFYSLREWILTMKMRNETNKESLHLRWKLEWNLELKLKWNEREKHEPENQQRQESISQKSTRCDLIKITPQRYHLFVSSCPETELETRSGFKIPLPP